MPVSKYFGPRVGLLLLLKKDIADMYQNGHVMDQLRETLPDQVLGRSGIAPNLRPPMCTKLNQVDGIVS